MPTTTTTTTITTIITKPLGCSVRNLTPTMDVVNYFELLISLLKNDDDDDDDHKVCSNVNDLPGLSTPIRSRLTVQRSPRRLVRLLLFVIALLLYIHLSEAFVHWSYPTTTWNTFERGNSRSNGVTIPSRTISTSTTTTTITHSQRYHSTNYKFGRGLSSISSSSSSTTTITSIQSPSRWFPKRIDMMLDNNNWNTNGTQTVGTNHHQDDATCTTSSSSSSSILFIVQYRAADLAARLIRQQLKQHCDNDDTSINRLGKNVATTIVATDTIAADTTIVTSLIEDPDKQTKSRLFYAEQIQPLLDGRFHDLTETLEGERVLEQLFFNGSDLLWDVWHDTTTSFEQYNHFDNKDIIRATVMIFQSLCILGTQVGVMGAPQQLRRNRAHLEECSKSIDAAEHDLEDWNSDSVRRLKYNVERGPAIDVLSKLQWRQSPQGAFDLLVQLGVWDKHEDLALLRSGFPIRFTKKEEKAATDSLEQARKSDPTIDIDTRLGLRQDLRHLKVYTIDSKSTSEIDDGVGIELLEEVASTVDVNKTNTRYRIWVHIADADRWAPRDSELFRAAQRRITSLYLPRASISMFPSKAATELMSLIAHTESCALSLGVELNDDGSINKSSLIVTPSLIRVAYRLSYDEVDEMLEEGIAYNEEWQLGALFQAASKRRDFRIHSGSIESIIPNQIPSGLVSTFGDKRAPDGIGVAVKIQVSHNAAKNKTASAEDSLIISDSNLLENEEPVSSANLLVTESMIMAGEAFGHWWAKVHQEEEESRKNRSVKHENRLRLAFRSQRRPDFKSRSREREIMLTLLEEQIGQGFCHAWFTRRFLESVSITEQMLPHSSLGLECYVQWSSPIRRFGDLQVHAAVKRFLRRRRAYELFEEGKKLPAGITASDLGIPEHILNKDGTILHDDSIITVNMLDQDIDFSEGAGLIGAARVLQRQSQQYWLYEYIQRQYNKDRDIVFTAVVLGCVDPVKQQYAIYVKELGLEHRYTSPVGRLSLGSELQLKVGNVSPRASILSFVRVV